MSLRSKVFETFAYTIPPPRQVLFYGSNLIRKEEFCTYRRYDTIQIIMAAPSLYNSVFHIDVDKVKPNPFQPRREFDEEKLRGLADSIRQYGVLQPLVVTEKRSLSQTEGSLPNTNSLRGSGVCAPQDLRVSRKCLL